MTTNPKLDALTNDELVKAISATWELIYRTRPDLPACVPLNDHLRALLKCQLERAQGAPNDNK